MNELTMKSLLLSFMSIIIFSLFFSGSIKRNPSHSNKLQNYPLSPGDYWEYRDPYFYDPVWNPTIIRKVIKDTVMNNSKSYAQFEGGWIKYQRFENGRVYFFDTDYDQEYLLYDFHASPNSKITTFIRGTDTTDIHFLGVKEDSIIYLKRWELQWHFYIDWDRQTYDEEAYHKIADGIGVTRMYGFAWRYDLRGAIISNDTLGYITSISLKSNNIYSYYLHQNYPNPFNPSATIEFDLPKATHVSLKIYNILGEEVITLVSDKLSAGSYSYEWDASRSAGIASGVYLYRLQAGDYVVTRKMILIR